MRRGGGEANATGTVRPSLLDFIWSRFPRTTGTSRIFRQVAVELQHNVVAKVDVGSVSMDRRQHIAVPGDLSFRTILRCRFLGHQRLDAAPCGHHALDPVRDSTLWIIAT